VPLREGGEEYLNSEKYEIRPRDWNQPGNIKDFITAVNRTRRENPALQLYRNLRFHSSDNGHILCYSKATADFTNRVLVVVNLDPCQPQESWVHLDLGALGLDGARSYGVHDQITGVEYSWHGGHNWVRLDPHHEPGHLFVIRA
jgi:starch synthase (maltosyl-transferring)